MANKCSKSRRSDKPVKPYDGFPLTIRPDGRLIKKHAGRQYYFGHIADWEAAVARYNREWPYIVQGRTPPPRDTENGCRIAHLCNVFLTAKKSKLDSGELSQRSFGDYLRTCELLVEHFGRDRRVDDLGPEEFRKLRNSMAKHWGAVTLRNEVNRCRVVLKFAYDERLIASPVHYGQSFARPSARTLRRAKREAGVKMFEAEEIRRMLGAADPVMHSMVLLAVNGGLGNSDVATLPQAAVDLDAGWIDYPRPKTEIARRIPLWPESISALRTAIELRPKPADPADDDLCFLTRRGRRWVRTQPRKDDPERFVALDALSQAFAKLLRRLDINGERGFYCFRRTFETVAGDSKDQVAVDAIMGHVDSSMAGTYRQRISDERLRAVVEVVHAWLWPAE